MVHILNFDRNFENIELSTIVKTSEEYRGAAKAFVSRTGKKFVYFQRGDLDLKTPSYVLDALHEGTTKLGYTNYPKSGGEAFFKDAVLEYSREQEIHGLTFENIAATYGGQQGLELLFGLFGKKTPHLLSRFFNMFRNKRAAGFGPCWSCVLDNMVPYSGVDFKMVPLREGNYDPGELEKVLKKSDMFYFNNPHNPTGKVFTRPEVEEIDYLCRKNNVLLVSDEAYNDVVFDGEHHYSTLKTSNPNSASVFTFSKSFAATGFRVGFTVSRNKKIIELMTLGDYTQTAGVVTANQYAFSQALNKKAERKAWIETLKSTLDERRNAAYDGLKPIFPNLEKPKGAFYFFVDFNPYLPDVPNKEKILLESLVKEGVLVAPGSGFGKKYEGWARISYSMIPAELIKEGTERIQKVVEELKEMKRAA
ncbi:MAG: pyridoxal phosphate-dependent aminotransferase [Nanoarchaeota archaeon]